MHRVGALIGNQWVRRFSSNSICSARNPWLLKQPFDRLSKLMPSVPHHVLEVVHNSNGEIPLNDEQRTTMLNYLTSQKTAMTGFDKSIFLKYLSGKKEYDVVVAMGQHHLFDGEGNYYSECAITHLIYYYDALIRTGQVEKLATEASKFISQFSINRQGSTVYVINYIFSLLFKFNSPETALYIWTKLVRVYYGHNELTNINIHWPFLSRLFYLFKANEESHRCLTHLLKRIEIEDSKIQASQLASTLITFFAHVRWFGEVNRIWQWKVDRNLPIIASDLTAAMRSRSHFKDWDEVIRLHNTYSLAHDDYNQFDYVLVALAKKQDWEKLKTQFDMLFGIGELPTVNHYGVIMYALSLHGELDLVERLHGQLLRRDMSPNYAVLLSIINAHYKAGDNNGAIREFALFKRYNIRPTSKTYLLMLKAYKKMGSLDSCFRILKTMSAEDVPIYETHFNIIIDLCDRYNNYPVAEELFNVMISDYSIQPTGMTVSTLARVFLHSNRHEKALKLLEKYESPKLSDNYKILQMKIAYFDHIGKPEKAEDLIRLYIQQKYQANYNFYLILLKHLVCFRRDYSSAEKVLSELLKSKSQQSSPNHFNILLEEYDRVGNVEGSLSIISKLVDNGITMNSKTLYFLVKSRFNLHRKRGESYENLIPWLEEVLDNIAKKKLNFNSPSIHPSVITWPMNFLSRKDDPSRAVDIFAKYVKTFYPFSKEYNEKLVVLRALMVFSAESERWDDFDELFERYKKRVKFYQTQSSAVVRNSNLKSAFVGLFKYQIQRLCDRNEIPLLPGLIHEIEDLGCILSNSEWNEAIWKMIRRHSTFDFAMKKLNGVFISGYTWIHRARNLKKQEKLGLSRGNTSSELSQISNRKVHLFLSSDKYELVMAQIDKHLRFDPDNLETELKRLIAEYPYVMKQYLRKPRTRVTNWELIEEKHFSFLQRLRHSHEIIPVEEF